jgi:hypothetical protein
MNNLQLEAEKLEREIMLKRKTLEMLPSAGDNIGFIKLFGLGMN